MTGSGPSGAPQARFEDGLRFLAAALALDLDHRHSAAIVSTACDAIQCFLVAFEAAARRRLPDPQGEVARLRGQLEALLTPRQTPEDAARNALVAARLARDQAARLLPRLID
ncbi:hypothetical protein [Geothrix sp.]|jgi:hypothetical protein|uniref:hypothetical protein n=1 Tax=Geothrix sp. TaxID=1962974 RepID=UPI0025C3909E|nr:hypothetical protein [Geothrix sp.]